MQSVHHNHDPQAHSGTNSGYPLDNFPYNPGISFGNSYIFFDSHIYPLVLYYKNYKGTNRYVYVRSDVKIYHTTLKNPVFLYK